MADNNKLRVLHVLIGKDFGGRALRTVSLSKYLIDLGFRVIVCGNYLDKFDKEYI